VQMQAEYLVRARQHAEATGLAQQEPYRQVLELWERTLKAFEAQDLALVETEIDWVLKWRTLQRYADRSGLSLTDPRMQQLDLAWHDIHPQRGLFNIVSRRGGASTVVDAGRIATAGHTPPQTTRAKLRGDFVAAAQAHHRDFSV